MLIEALQYCKAKNEIAMTEKPEPIVVKKYANRRLYNTSTSTYVTLDDLCQLVKEEKDFVVFDAKSGEDLTRQILAQIIFEQESKGHNLMPISLLRSFISMYDNKMGGMMSKYLEASIEAFKNNEHKVREAFGNMPGFAAPLNQLEEIGKQNMALMQKTFSMFNPFEGYFGKKDGEEEESAGSKRRASSGKK